MEDIINLLGQYKEAVIAGVSAVVALFGAYFSSRETRKQRKILKETLRQRLDEASLAWGDEAINALAAAEGLVTHTKFQGFTQQRTQLAQELSALADRGRMYFPNSDEQAKGQSKEGAFRGSRAPILEALIFANLEVKATEEGRQGTPEYINRCRRLLVSELQAHVDPRQRDAVIGRYDSQRKAHVDDASRRASALQAELESRRPWLFKNDLPESPEDDG